MKDLQNYEWLPASELVHNLWLIVCIEAADYCKSCHQNGIRFIRLKERCDNALNLITNGEFTNFGGSFESIIYSHRYESFWKVVKLGKKETWVYPNIQAIENEIRYKKLADPDSRDKPRIRVLPPNAIVQFKKSIDEPPVSVSERLEVKVIRATDSR